MIKKIGITLFVLFSMAEIFAFKYDEGFSVSGALTIPFTWEQASWNSTSRTTMSSGAGGELHGRFKPYGLPFGFYAQININQPRTITEKQSSTTLTSKASDYDSIYAVDLQTGPYFLAYKSDTWFIPVGIGFHYKFDSNEVASIKTQTNMFGIGAFVHAEYTLSEYLSTFIGANISYDIYGGSRRESNAGSSSTVYYNETGSLKAFSVTPKIGLVFHMR